MFPIILVSQSEKDAETFIKDSIHTYSIPKNFVYKIVPEKSELSINQVRAIKKDIKIKVPHARLFVFYQFHKASLETQNSLLKLLEEKTLNNLFILVTNNEYSVLPTIRSRSRVVFANKNFAQKKKGDKSIQQLVETLRKKEGYDFLSTPPLIQPTREEVSILLRELILFFRSNYGPFQTASPAIIKKSMDYLKLLETNNTNPQLTLDTLLIFIQRRIRMNS